MRYHNLTPFWRDNVNGTAGSDEIFTYYDNDIIHGFEGNDTLNGGASDDTIYGGDDNDKIFGEVGSDRLYGDDGNDTIDGGTGNDQLFGGDGEDTLRSFSGSRMFGGDENDSLTYFAGNEMGLVDGGAGYDRLAYLPESNVQVKLKLGEGGAETSAELRYHEYRANILGVIVEDLGLSDAYTFKVRSIENVTTGVENDQITGNSDVNRISTNGGSDVLNGRGGEDFLNSGGGSDTFIFEAVSDSVMGRTGLANSSPNFAMTDLIFGFGDSTGNQDILDLSRIDAMQTTTSIGNQNFRMDDGDGSIEIGELQFRTITDGEQSGRNVTAVAADTNGDGQFDFGIRFDRVVTSLDAGDFIL